MMPGELKFRLRAALDIETPACAWWSLSTVERQWARYRYRETLGRELNLESPRAFTEKVMWRMLNDRRQIWRLVRDKFRVREFIRSRVGDQYLIPLLHKTRSPETIPFDDLPTPYIIKPSHMSGVVFMVRAGDRPDAGRRQEIVEDLHWYLANHAGFPYGVFPWYESDPRVVVERLLVSGDDRIPRDYKFHCFDGEPHFVQVHEGRFSNHRCTIYDAEFNRLPIKLRYPTQHVDRPDRYEQLLDVASRLADGFDYIRVDLYDVSGDIYVGEITPYDGGGLKGFDPARWDLEWGRRWQLPPTEAVGSGRNDTDGSARSEGD